MLVMISGKLTESSHDPSNVQVVATQTEEEEELSLQNLNGIFLTVLVGKIELLRTSLPVSGRELSVPTLVSDSSRTMPDLDSEASNEFDNHTLQESVSNEEALSRSGTSFEFVKH